MLVENGGTVVIGGIYSQDERTDITKVPFFGDLPVLGCLFKNNTTLDNKTELLVFITPRIVERAADGPLRIASSSLDATAGRSRPFFLRPARAVAMARVKGVPTTSSSSA